MSIGSQWPPTQMLEWLWNGRGKWAHEQCDDFERQGKPRKK